MKITQIPLLAGILALTAGSFVLDLYTPLGVALWTPYVVVVLISLWFPRPWQAYATAGICSVLTIVALFLSPPGLDFWWEVGNRSMAVVAFWIATAIGLKARRAVELERSNRALQAEIRHRKELEAQLLRSQRLESIGVLTGGIAHDFNNLLTPILMATKLLGEERPAAEQRHLLETLRASAERAAELVRKLLAFAGGLHREPAAIELSEVIAEVEGIVEHTFGAAISVRTRIGEHLPPVLADATQLSQVLMNLCVNARDAMPGGGTLSLAAEKVAVDEEFVRAHPDARAGDFVRITVEDSGCGMSAEVLNRMFDPFFTTKTRSKGSGLGLSTALGIVRGHGGFFQVESELGQGSRFAIYLPTQPEASQEAPSPAKSEGGRGGGEFLLVGNDKPATMENGKDHFQTRE